MQQSTESAKSEDGSSLSAAGNEEKGATASKVSNHDLKMLSFELVREVDGIFYFSQPGRNELVRGDEIDAIEVRTLKRIHPLIDAETALAILNARIAANTPTPFGTVAGDLVAS